MQTLLATSAITPISSNIILNQATNLWKILLGGLFLTKI